MTSQYLGRWAPLFLISHRFNKMNGNPFSHRLLSEYFYDNLPSTVHGYINSRLLTYNESKQKLYRNELHALWWLVMYFCIHNCTSPSNDYAAVACSTTTTRHSSLTYQFLTDDWLGLELLRDTQLGLPAILSNSL